MVRIAIPCALFLAGCASRGGWMEGDEVNVEVRRVLASQPRDGVGVETPKATLHIGAGLDDERDALLATLVRAEAIRGGPAALHAVVAALDPAQPAGPRPDPATCRPPEVTEVWILYSDCLCKARRWAFESDVVGYTVVLEDRRFGDDRSFAYSMRLIPSPALDKAWDALLAAAERSPAALALAGA